MWYSVLSVLYWLGYTPHLMELGLYGPELYMNTVIGRNFTYHCCLTELHRALSSHIHWCSQGKSPHCLMWCQWGPQHSVHFGMLNLLDTELLLPQTATPSCGTALSFAPLWLIWGKKNITKTHNSPLWNMYARVHTHFHSNIPNLWNACIQTFSTWGKSFKYKSQIWWRFIPNKCQNMHVLFRYDSSIPWDPFFPGTPTQECSPFGVPPPLTTQQLLSDRAHCDASIFADITAKWRPADVI